MILFMHSLTDLDMFLFIKALIIEIDATVAAGVQVTSVHLLLSESVKQQFA